MLESSWSDYTHSIDKTILRGRALSEKEAWSKYGAIIEATWRAFVKGLVPGIIWELTELFTSKWLMRRSMWTAKGGWLFTKRGTRRKRWSKKIKPPKRANVITEIDAAYFRLNEARRMENTTGRFSANRLIIQMLGLTGGVVLPPLTGATATRLPFHERLTARRSIWPWPQRVSSRLERLTRDGIIERWNKDERDTQGPQ